ncbi:hypothetical protein [Nostoc sp. LPT]|uniref:hypothetical protein n=1 Tax=Nostoc sp. LPT TaxID=2815387 RepID=UPI001D7ADDCA|nr:hypothetical protein [Nostoc sp. LPT]MBN4006358.1 hypothetical protein [Nostoc sp. LPT]
MNVRLYPIVQLNGTPNGGISCNKRNYGIKPIGFISEFYAVRYLYQIAEVAFPDIIQDIPNLPWQ